MKQYECSEELRNKLMSATTQEEVCELIKAEYPDIEPEALDKITDEFLKYVANRELSMDELDAVAGGARNYRDDGCKGDYKDEFCWFNDHCAAAIITYYNYDSHYKCPRCGANLYFWDTVSEGIAQTKFSRYNCYNCNGFFKHTGTNTFETLR
ncbi:MAG: hypothetical protein K5745_00595 [Saccharofermentans sp.]|nr:hypothetical protein [Saccharofermentans sp.]